MVMHQGWYYIHNDEQVVRWFIYLPTLVDHGLHVYSLYFWICSIE